MLLTIILFCTNAIAMGVCCIGNNRQRLLIMTSETKEPNENSKKNGKPDWKAKTKGYEDYIFYIGKGMQDDFVGNDRDICAYIHKTYGGDVLESMKKGTMTISDMDPPQEFDTVEDKKKVLTTLNAELDWDDHRKEYFKSRMSIQKDLGKVAGLLESHCHLTMKNKLKSDKEYQGMKSSDAAELYRIIKRISTGSESVLNPARGAVESLYNMMFLRGQDHDSLTAYYEQFEHRAENAERLGMWLGSELLRDMLIQDYRN